MLLGHHHPDAHPDDALRERRLFLPDLGWWRSLRWRWDCRRTRGHCWHPSDPMIGWACCSCPAEVDGMPADRCRTCAALRQEGPR